MLSPVRRTWALNTFTLLWGFGSATWVSRTPALREELALSTGQVGLVLFGGSVGSMAGVIASGPATRRFGPRLVTAIALALAVLGLGGVAVGVPLRSPVIVAIGLAFWGFAGGFGEIAMNIEAAVLEVERKRILLPIVHGCFSLGTVIGALAGTIIVTHDVPVLEHVGGAALLLLLAAGWVVSSIAPGPRGGATAEPQTVTGGVPAVQPARVWADPVVRGLAVVVLAMAFAEGSANDWLPLAMIDVHGASPQLGSATFLAFTVAMTVGRFAGTPLLARFGRVTILRASAVSAALGIVAVVTLPSIGAATVAALFWGLGASLGFPISVSAAGDHPDGPRRVSAVATAGYAAFLVGPPVLGFLGDHVGLGGALAVPAVLAVVAFFFTPAAREREAARSPR